MPMIAMTRVSSLPIHAADEKSRIPRSGETGALAPPESRRPDA